ncbi:uncharacterized protein BDZ99DRAFT_2611 [Mytilinidion resinicola]|uniref:Uncharacterized protein n=1 Tax=Mytilinidion resinicola TaxID=574789 RepID=A0A6A6Z721_9PEZI|nr:uncharacterized protein BDZ99DRAFT_2611 [Mytilinidion resinicola]KAF2816830.1 hypothetical protein BDZ99DRAFT_2611 [Mytilinidion resinicola]
MSSSFGYPLNYLLRVKHHQANLIEPNRPPPSKALGYPPRASPPPGGAGKTKPRISSSGNSWQPAHGSKKCRRSQPPSNSTTRSNSYLQNSFKTTTQPREFHPGVKSVLAGVVDELFVRTLENGGRLENPPSAAAVAGFRKV